MREVVDFLRELRANNNREWFNAHKAEYRRADSVFKEFAAALVDGIASFDESVRGLTLADCTYRIYRDTRFSPDKTPYKTHMGVFVAPHGKKAGYAGYYFHLDPNEGSMMYAGLYMPEPIVLKSVREEIIDNGDGLMAAVEAANGFTLCTDNALKRNPKDFPPGNRYDNLLRLRDFGLEKPVSERQVLSKELLKHTLDDFRSTYPLVGILNRAVQYAYEEMM